MTTRSLALPLLLGSILIFAGCDDIRTFPNYRITDLETQRVFEVRGVPEFREDGTLSFRLRPEYDHVELQSYTMELIGRDEYLVGGITGPPALASEITAER